MYRLSNCWEILFVNGHDLKKLSMCNKLSIIYYFFSDLVAEPQWCRIGNHSQEDNQRIKMKWRLILQDIGFLQLHLKSRFISYFFITKFRFCNFIFLVDLEDIQPRHWWQIRVIWITLRHEVRHTSPRDKNKTHSAFWIKILTRLGVVKAI